MSSVVARVETVTPEKARRWLDERAQNRHMNEERVKKYVGAMERLEWRVNGEGIIFDCNGQLIDGQHRLAAVVQSGISLPMLIVRGVEPEVFSTLDSGQTRTLGQILKMKGYPYFQNLSSMANNLFMYAAGYDLRTRTHHWPTPQQAIQFIEDNPEIVESTKVGTLIAVELRCSVLAIGMLHFLATQIDEDGSDVSFFFDALRHGEGLMRGDPIYALRSRLQAEGRGLRRLPSVEQFALGIKAWNAYRRGERVTALRWRAGGASPEAMPSLI